MSRAAARREVFGTRGCPYTAELLEELEWQGKVFVYHDVEEDPAALARMLELSGGGRTVPVLVEDDAVIEVGYRGRGCVVAGR